VLETGTYFGITELDNELAGYKRRTSEIIILKMARLSALILKGNLVTGVDQCRSDAIRDHYSLRSCQEDGQT